MDGSSIIPGIEYLYYLDTCQLRIVDNCKKIECTNGAGNSLRSLTMVKLASTDTKGQNMVNEGGLASLLHEIVRRCSFTHSRKICTVTVRPLISMILPHQLLNIKYFKYFSCSQSLSSSTFQFTETGVAGLNGLIVTSRATVETRQESASVIILNQLLEGKTAKVR